MSLKGFCFSNSYVHIVFYLHVMQAFQTFYISKYTLSIYFKYPWDFKINIEIFKYHICMFTVSLMLINGYMAILFVSVLF